jgi:hypothetical protein
MIVLHYDHKLLHTFYTIGQSDLYYKHLMIINDDVRLTPQIAVSHSQS